MLLYSLIFFSERLYQIEQYVFTIALLAGNFLSILMLTKMTELLLHKPIIMIKLSIVILLFILQVSILFVQIPEVEISVISFCFFSIGFLLQIINTSIHKLMTTFRAIFIKSYWISVSISGILLGLIMGASYLIFGTSSGYSSISFYIINILILCLLLLLIKLVLK